MGQTFSFNAQGERHGQSHHWRVARLERWHAWRPATIGNAGSIVDATCPDWRGHVNGINFSTSTRRGGILTLQKLASLRGTKFYAQSGTPSVIGDIGVANTPIRAEQSARRNERRGCAQIDWGLGWLGTTRARGPGDDTNGETHLI
jgi:hypothetical protein